MTAQELSNTFRAKLEDKSLTVGIVGLGYVGLPIVREFHAAGFAVIGFDTDQRKIGLLDQGVPYLKHLGTELSETLAKSDRFRATSDAEQLAEADAILLCVPTPLGQHREPDLSFVLSSTEMCASILRPGQLIVLESTTYPGTTRNEMPPVLEKSGLKCGEDFFVAYSPEREDPGREDATTQTTPKLVGGLCETSGNLATLLYETIVDSVHPVSSAEVAESAKLLENIYRAVNIALVNELKVVLAEMKIDVWEVIEAASTKPFGFQAFYPGPGLGGHCIPIDPFYLTWKAKEVGETTRFIELAGEVNTSMPGYVVSRTAGALNDVKKPVNGSKILVIGVAYKPNIDDVRESPAAEVIEGLQALGADVSYHDPHVAEFPSMRKHKIQMTSQALNEKTVRNSDLVLIITDHSDVDWDLIGEHAGLIVDTRNAMHQRVTSGPVIKA